MSGSFSQVYAFDEFRVDVAKRLLIRGEAELIPLTPKVFDTLVFLVQSGGRAVGKDELMREIWPDSVVEENNLTQNVSILRRAFGEKPGQQRFIITVAGLGYRFVPEVRPLPASPPASDPRVEQEATQSPRRLLTFAVALLVLAVAAGTWVWLRYSRSSDTSIKSLAVLPFKPLAVERRNEVVELGMADTLISKLSGVAITVRPLSAVRRYGSIEQDPLAAGRELGVDSVLDGTMQTLGNRMRISARLIRTSDGRQLWAGQFDERSSDIFAVQDSIAEKVAAALEIRLRARKKKHDTENIEAYQLYMQAHYQLSKLRPSNLDTASANLRQAIALDPSYALAYTELAAVYRVYAISGARPAIEMFSKAKAASQKAVALDASLAEAHLSLAQDHYWYDRDWAAAEDQYRQAQRLDANNPVVRINYALLLSTTGRHAEALMEAQRARELGPAEPGINALEGLCLLHAGRVDEALDRLRKTSELEPAFWMPHSFAASAYIDKGMFAEAIAEDRRERDLTGMNTVPFGAYALAKSGDTAAARIALNDALTLSRQRHVPPYNIALLYNALGMHAEALTWLERGFEHHDPKMVFLGVEPKWNTLRQEPRFVSLLKRMHLE